MLWTEREKERWKAEFNRNKVAKESPQSQETVFTSVASQGENSLSDDSEMKFS